MTKPINEELFWSKVRLAGKTDCWIWMASRYPKGYGHFTEKRNGKTHNYYAHRAAYSLWPGNQSPEGKVVMHKCDNPACCNPFHLQLGTQKQNMEDMVSKGRSAFGIKHRSKKHPELVLRGEMIGNAKITEQIVLEIRNRRSNGETLEAIASDYSIAFQTVSKIVNRQSWRHV